MLDLDLAEVVQIRLPFCVLAEIFRNPLREQDVPCIPTRHDPLRDVDRSAGNVGPVVHVRGTANGPAVHPHPQFQPRISR